ncbi:unnamed protein product [Tetraodon nigroviridis]|uniref:(spotted green pufferfish) hypothetical protein n=1 Tax=Tetraodon nigroviridis TaxID=99883 RepID=Q4T128_TETNG|nr:unnamed protein product [Tetraodon nigroviridis]
MFLPHIELSELETECFSKILPKAVTMFDSMMKEVMDQAGGLSSQNTQLCSVLRNILQAMMQVMDALSTCVRHVGTFENAPDLDAIRSLPTCILKILKQTFQHCKDSETVYCGRLSLVADLLQALFKDAYTLQKALLELLDKMSFNTGASGNEVSDIVSIIHSLLDICFIISNLDMALHANTWKFVIKQSSKYQSLVEEHLHHGDISSSLCDNLLVYLHNCFELADQIKLSVLQEATQRPEYKLFQKTAKMCRFFANTLIHYIKEFKFSLTKHCSRFHQLFLQVFSKFPPCIGAPTITPALSEELSAAALVPMDAVLLQLLPLRSFAESVLQNELRLSPEHKLPQCLLLVNVLSQLTSQPEEALQLWHAGSAFSEETPRLPLYKALFTSFTQCLIERQVPVLLPGVMTKGQAQVQVTLYQHVCVHLCASVAALSPTFFSVLEQCLASAVLQADTLTALLATDVWCFTARYGTADLCLHHALVIAQLVKLCAADSYQASHLGLLLRRMIFLMVPNHQVRNAFLLTLLCFQMELVTRFPPSEVENLTVWRQILLRAFSKDVRLRVELDIINLAQKVLTDWENGGYRLGQVDKVNAMLSALLVVVRGFTAADEEHVLSTVPLVTQLWLRMSPDQVQTHPVLQSTLQLLLSISAVLVKNIEHQVISQALLCVDSVVSQQCAQPELVLAALEFLSFLGKVFVPPDSQNQILPRISSLFGVFLSEPSWLLHQHALEAFSQFAETVNAVEDTESRLQRIKLEAAVIEQHNSRLESQQEKNSDKETCRTSEDSEPCPKKARQEAGTEEYSRYIQTAESALKALQALTEGKSNTTPIPQWLESRLQELQNVITKINTATHKQ